MKSVSPFIAALLLCVSLASAQRTTRAGLRPTPGAAEAQAPETANVDTLVAPGRNIVDVSGYDKPLRSRRETFFVTNNSGKAVEEISFTIKYYDTRQRMLHSASHKVKVAIPDTETRQVSVRSWDSQFNFYYSRSAVPQRAQQATPYDVAISLDTLFTSRALPAR